MARVKLQRLLRGGGKELVAELGALVGAPIRVEDDAGRALLGDAAATGERHPIEVSGARLGVVVGPPSAHAIARLLGALGAREEEKLALADETLGRYKELTLLYDISDKLSRVLDVDEVCRMVVAEAKGFLRATGASILLLDARRTMLEAIASTEDRPRTRTLAATVGVEGRVLRTGRAELVEDASTTDSGSSESGVRAVMCAPLRTGETVFGILRVISDEATVWTAGDLKLVTSLAGNAASAISHAMLHRERLRQQALRHDIERFASPWVLDAAFGKAASTRSVAALFCDLGELTRTADVSLDPDEVMTLVRRATASVLQVLMREGATVQLSHAEMIVGLFASENGIASAARAASRAASQIVRALDRRFGGFVERSPGVAITHAELVKGNEADAFFAAISHAATLQSSADGRIVVDETIGAALEGERSEPSSSNIVHEVRA